MIFLVTVVVVEQSSVHHDWVVFLSDLVTLGKIRVDIVFPVKLNERRDTASKSERASNSLIEAVFI